MLERLIMGRTLTEKELREFTLECLHRIMQENQSNRIYFHESILFLDCQCEEPICGMKSMGLNLIMLAENQFEIIIISE